jgi:hypothetical protein
MQVNENDDDWIGAVSNDDEEEDTNIHKGKQVEQG